MTLQVPPGYINHQLACNLSATATRESWKVIWYALNLRRRQIISSGDVTISWYLSLGKFLWWFLSRGDNMHCVHSILLILIDIQAGCVWLFLIWLFWVLCWTRPSRIQCTEFFKRPQLGDLYTHTCFGLVLSLNKT